MKTLAIRELTGPALRRAAEADEIIGITNDRILAGVLIPISQQRVEELVEENVSQIVRNGPSAVREMPPGAAGAADPQRQPAARPVADGAAKRLRRVNLRDISGSVLQAAAEENEAIILTTDRIVAGLIYPITQDWVADLVAQNLERILHNVSIGEKELAAGHPMTTLDDIVP